MSDRLDELRRQRALVQQQLEWLDSEIAAETAGSSASPPTGAANPERPRPTSPIESISLTREPSPADPDAIIKHYSPDTQSAEEQTRRGCWAVFGLAFAALAAFVTAWYFLRNS